MSKLLFKVKELFSRDSQDGCLGIHDAERYYIASYQRGYKWLSSPEWMNPAQVNTLLRDIYDAWNRNPESTYYLQFITVKRSLVHGHFMLEVIDGQQRLTTLSILAAILHWKFHLDDFVDNTIDYYSCDEKESQNCKSKKCLAEFHARGWNAEFHEKVDDQTVWFMTQAYRNLDGLLEEKFSSQKEKQGDAHAHDERVASFYKYLTNRTLVIVNLVQENVIGEEVFENLNGRRVTLTDAELIKGLLLCQAARRADAVSYPEVLEHRADMGRTWDEMERWMGKKEVAPFFFGDNRFPLYDFLLLVLLYNEGNALHDEQWSMLYDAREEQSPSITKRYRLFNKYYERISSPHDALQLFRFIEDMYWKMRDAYDDIARHNAFGFLFFRKNGVERLRLIGTLSGLGATWQNETYRQVSLAFANRGKDEDTSSLEKFLQTYRNGYDNKSEYVRQDLLLLNCFELGKDGEFKANDRLAFPFYDLEASATNSLEHVQCQTPIGGNGEDAETMTDQLKKHLTSIHDWFFTVRYAEGILNCKDSYNAEAEELRGFLDDHKNVFELARTLEKEDLTEDQFTEDQWQQLAALYLGLANIHYGRFARRLSEFRQKEFEGVETQVLHSIGNLVLVTVSLNTALKNHVFMTKRKKLRDKVNGGETIPPHTFNVFTKMNGTGGHADCWCAEDAAANAVETLTLLCKLRQKLEPYRSHEGGNQ